MEWLLVSILIAQESIKSLMSYPEKAPTIYQLRSLQAVANEDSADVIWYEDFREGLDGNNSSVNPAWSVSGDDGDVWELDFDGSNGDYAMKYTLFIGVRICFKWLDDF